MATIHLALVFIAILGSLSPIRSETIDCQVKCSQVFPGPIPKTDQWFACYRGCRLAQLVDKTNDKTRKEMTNSCPDVCSQVYNKTNLVKACQSGCSSDGRVRKSEVTSKSLLPSPWTLRFFGTDPDVSSSSDPPMPNLFPKDPFQAIIKLLKKTFPDSIHITSKSTVTYFTDDTESPITVGDGKGPKLDDGKVPTDLDTLLYNMEDDRGVKVTEDVPSGNKTRLGSVIHGDPFMPLLLFLSTFLIFITIVTCVAFKAVNSKTDYMRVLSSDLEADNLLADDESDEDGEGQVRKPPCYEESMSGGELNPEMAKIHSALFVAFENDMKKQKDKKRRPGVTNLLA